MFGVGYPCGPPPTMMIPVTVPKKRSNSSCPDDDGTAKITAQMAADFFEQFNKEGDCKVVSADVNGQEYKIKLMTKNKKHSNSDNSDRCPDKPKSQSSQKGPKVKLCDCDVPMPANLCPPDDGLNKKALAREERMNKNLSLCIKMMRELFIKEYNKHQEEEEDSVRMVEIPVMVVPGVMPGMGMPGMGMTGMSMPGMGMPGMGMPGMCMPPGMGKPGGGCNHCG